MPDDRTAWEKHFDDPPLAPADEKAQREAIDLARAYRRVFSGIDGETVLTDLRNNFERRTSLHENPSVTQGNEGKRFVILYILTQMETAESAGPAASSIAE
jgi:hypothetical protein